MYYFFDPKAGWAPKIKNWKWKEGTEVPLNPWKKTMAACKLDGCLYVRQWNGQIVKVDPKTNEAETVYKTPQGEGYGAAFHPKYPNLLYLSFDWDAGDLGNSICTFDVVTRELKKLSASGSGHRDGPVEVALFNRPMMIQFDMDGNLYIADMNECIRRITPENVVETVVGVPGVAGFKDGGPGEALFRTPWGVGVAPDGTVYIAELGNARIRKLAIE
jgi:streptogramin lyase